MNGTVTRATTACCLPCLLFYSRVTNYMIFGHCAITFQMSEHWVDVLLVLSLGYLHVCDWACSILLCPGFYLVPAHVSMDPPVLLTPETSGGEHRFGNKWLSGIWIKYYEWLIFLPPLSLFLSIYSYHMSHKFLQIIPFCHCSCGDVCIYHSCHLVNGQYSIAFYLCLCMAVDPDIKYKNTNKNKLNKKKKHF